MSHADVARYMRAMGAHEMAELNEVPEVAPAWGRRDGVMAGPVMPKTIKCKFCKADVRYDTCGGRVWEMDRDEYHVSNCPRRQAHFKQQGYQQAQAQRSAATMPPQNGGTE